MNFALIMFVLLVVMGGIWLVDHFYLRSRRGKDGEEPWWVAYPKSFFPVILVVFLLRSFLVEPFKIPSGSMIPTLLVPRSRSFVTNQVSSALHPGMHGTTFGGGPLACAVALTVLDVLEREDLVARNRTLGIYFQAQLEKLKRKHRSVTEVRVLGLMAALELDSADLAKTVVKQMLERGIIINRTHETALRILL